MSDSGRWKSKLLSSSVPMEYEVAKKLVELGFVVSADYSYSREDAGITKDFSVDIHATGYLPFESDSYNATLELLVECKQRYRGNKWLFFPDPNTEEMSLFMIGDTLRAVDNFSKTFFKSSCTSSLDDMAIFCMKGVEIDFAGGSVHDSEIKHGLAQLQYALPRLFLDTVKFNLPMHDDDNVPFFFCPILLTTSEIVIAKNNMCIEDVEQAKTIEDIANPAKFVILHLDITPDFERHRALVCKPLAKLAKSPEAKDIDKFKLQNGEYEFELPSEICTALTKVNKGNFRQYFSQVIVCSLEYFPELIAEIKTISIKATLEKEATKRDFTQ